MENKGSETKNTSSSDGKCSCKIKITADSNLKNI